MKSAVAHIVTGRLHHETVTGDSDDANQIIIHMIIGSEVSKFG